MYPRREITEGKLLLVAYQEEVWSRNDRAGAAEKPSYCLGSFDSSHAGRLEMYLVTQNWRVCMGCCVAVIWPLLAERPTKQMVIYPNDVQWPGVLRLQRLCVSAFWPARVWSQHLLNAWTFALEIRLEKSSYLHVPICLSFFTLPGQESALAWQSWDHAIHLLCLISASIQQARACSQEQGMSHAPDVSPQSLPGCYVDTELQTVARISMELFCVRSVQQEGVCWDVPGRRDTCFVCVAVRVHMRRETLLVTAGCGALVHPPFTTSPLGPWTSVCTIIPPHLPKKWNTLFYLKKNNQVSCKRNMVRGVRSWGSASFRR